MIRLVYKLVVIEVKNGKLLSFDKRINNSTYIKTYLSSVHSLIVERVKKKRNKLMEKVYNHIIMTVNMLTDSNINIYI